MYADELLSRGDVRGELMQLQLSTVRDARVVARERALLAAHEALGGPQQVLAALDATWRRGFLSRVRAPSVAALRVLLTHPSGAWLDELVLDNPSLALDEQVDLVGRSRHAGLRALEVRADSGATHFEGEVGLGHALALPGLLRLSAWVRELSLTTKLPRTSVVETLELSARELPLHALATWAFPALRVLDLGLLNSGVWVRWSGVAQDLPLEWRQLELPPALISGALTPRLERLVLRGWNVDSTGADAVVSLLASLAAVQVDLRECRVEPGARTLLGERVLLPVAG